MDAQTIELQFPSEGGHLWASMGNYVLISPKGKHKIDLTFSGEPPHGDSYHELKIDGKTFPGYAWGCCFVFSADARYFGFSWMESRYERKTIIADLQVNRYFVLPQYIYEFDINWPYVQGSAKIDGNRLYEFAGDEQWLAF